MIIPNVFKKLGAVGLVSFLFLASAVPAFAVTPRGSEPEGRVLQAATTNCATVALTVTPSSIKRTENLFFRIAVANNCTFGINTNITVYYNADSLLNPVGENFFAPGQKFDNLTFPWGASGLKDLTQKTQFYAVMKYRDAGQQQGANNTAISAPVEITITEPTNLPVFTGAIGSGATAPGVKDTNNASATAVLFSCANPLNIPQCALQYVVQEVLNLFIQALKAGALFLGRIAELALAIPTYSNDFAAIIYPAWEVVRNLGNIVFILAIVAIGIATVFRISGWAVKDLLVKLITGALLINFSLSITQAILGISDTLQFQFLAPGSGALAAIVTPLFTTDWFGGINAAVSGGSVVSVTVQAFINFFIAFAAFIAVLGLTGLLIARLVAIWLILLTSPLPYVAMILPITKKLGSDWWTKLFKWAFTAPVIAFMLTLTATIVTKYHDADILQTIAKGGIDRQGAFAQTTSTLMQAFIPLVFLYATVKVSTSFSKGLGGFVEKTIDKGAKAALLPAAYVGGAVATAAKTPFTLAGKGVSSAVGNVRDKVKDDVKLGYLKTLNKFAPDGDKKGFVASLGRTAFNAASGGALTDVYKQKRKGDIEDEQGRIKAKSKDIRSRRRNETARAEQAFDDAQIAKAAKDKKEEVRDNTSKDNIDAMVGVLGSQASGFSKTVEMLERTALALEKNSFDDFRNKVVEQHYRSIGDTQTADAIAAGTRGGGRDATIEEFYEAGAGAGIDKRHLEQLRDKVNGKMISDGKLNNVIDGNEVVMVDGAKGSTRTKFDQVDKTENDKFRKKRWEKKSARYQAESMDKAMFADPVLLASHILSFSKLNGGKKNSVAEVFSPEKLATLAELFKDQAKSLELERQLQAQAPDVNVNKSPADLISDYRSFVKF